MVESPTVKFVEDHEEEVGGVLVKDVHCYSAQSLDWILN